MRYFNFSNGNNFPRNQTEIIYSVFVDGKPVLAATAADDMKLLSEVEVADVMEKLIYTKAERKKTLFPNSHLRNRKSNRMLYTMLSSI